MEDSRRIAEDGASRASELRRPKACRGGSGQAKEERIERLYEDLCRLADRLEEFGRTQPDHAASRSRDNPSYERYDSIKQRLFVASLRIETARALVERDEEVGDKHLAQAEALVREAQTDLKASIYAAPN